MDVLQSCTDVIGSIESFDDKEIASRFKSERLHAINSLPRKTFLALSDSEVPLLSATMEKMEIQNIVLNKAFSIQKKFLHAPDMMKRTSRLGSSIRDRILVPELFTMYISQMYQLEGRNLIQELTLGCEGQLRYHSFLKQRVSTCRNPCNITFILNVVDE